MILQTACYHMVSYDIIWHHIIVFNIILRYIKCNGVDRDWLQLVIQLQQTFDVFNKTASSKHLYNLKVATFFEHNRNTIFQQNNAKQRFNRNVQILHST